MITSRFIRVEADGRVFNVKQDMEELKLSDSFAEMIGSSNTRPVFSVMRAEDISPDLKNCINPISCQIINSAGEANWSMQLPYIPINTHFKVWEDGLLTPSFSNSSNPLMSVQWNPTPLEMRVYWFVQVARHVTSTKNWIAAAQYMVALDKSGNMYRLPISNTYENCTLCTGQYNNTDSSHIGLLRRAWHQFSTAEWQGDLYDSMPDTYRQRTDMMFRFKAGKEKGFEQQPSQFPTGKHWTAFADKVGNEWLTKNIIH